MCSANSATSWLFSAALITVMVGCTGAEEGGITPATAAAVRDSSGIRLVEHDLPSLGATEAIDAQLSSLPQLRVDSVPRATESDLHQIAGAVVLDGGRLVLGHGSTKELLFFDSTATSATSAGRGGSGPGEFRSLLGPWPVHGNRVAVFDRSQRRHTVLESDGSVNRMQLITAAMLPDSVSSIWASFGMTAQGTALLWVNGPPVETIGMVRPPMTIVAMDSSGATWRVGDKRGGLERYAMQPRSDGVVSFGLSPFAPTPLVAPCGEMLLAADNQTYEVALLGVDGTMSMLLRAQSERREAQDQDYRAALEAKLGLVDVRDDQIFALRMFTPSGLLPVLKSVRCDEAMNIWVEEWPYELGQYSRVTSYARDGSRRFAIRLEAEMRLLAARSNEVVLAIRDEDGVERVEIRTVISAATAGDH